MDMKKIGANITAFRKVNGYTQEALADRLGLSPQAVSKWETGTGLPEASVLIELAEIFRVSIDEILRPSKTKNIPDFINRNLLVPDSKVLDYVPRISRWNPPKGCDMFYSFPATIAAALCCIEAREQGRNDVSYDEMNGRFRDLMHITGMGYGFLWNVVKQHLIEELWHVNNLSEMVERIMGYYGRDYIWLTPNNATVDDVRKVVTWSIANGRPVVAEWLGGLPEFNIISGYENNGKTLIGYTYCEECATQINEHGMFVNPARWDELTKQSDIFHVLVVGDKIQQTVSDRDTIEYALQVLDKNDAGNKEHFLASELIGGDKALYAWLKACDTDENTIKLFQMDNIFNYALSQNTLYTQKAILPYFKGLGARSNRAVNDTAIQMDIAVSRITGEGNGVREAIKNNPANVTENAAACRRHIENFIKHREYMRGWLQEIKNSL